MRITATPHADIFDVEEIENFELDDTSQGWDTLGAIDAVSGIGKEKHSADEANAAWQYLINTGECWRMGGWFSRTAQALIDSGECVREP